MWESALVPSGVTLESILNPPETSLQGLKSLERIRMYTSIEERRLSQKLLEKDVLNKIINAPKYPAKGDSSKDIVRYYGSIATAVIHPPELFKLPDMLFCVCHHDKQSSFGEEDVLIIHLWLKTPAGYSYVPVATVQDSRKALTFRREFYTGTPAQQNVQLVEKDELQVRIYGNTVFAGWTVPIPLFPPPYALPPSCIVFEGYGNLRTNVIETLIPSGRRQEIEFNGFEAFVTFFHPSSKYAGPGTDGLFARDVITTSYPP
jgi:hypothetical protein